MSAAQGRAVLDHPTRHLAKDLGITAIAVLDALGDLDDPDPGAM